MKGKSTTASFALIAALLFRSQTGKQLQRLTKMFTSKFGREGE
jgi:hypothetical protein